MALLWGGLNVEGWLLTLTAVEDVGVAVVVPVQSVVVGFGGVPGRGP